MANELTYQSEFTGQQMDAKFTAVGELTAALEALTGVVAQKYVKPADGIPATDMDADVQAALAKALTAVQSLADYYTKAEVDALLAAINAQEYVDVSSLPTASASTMGKIYLVGPDGSGYYSYYISSYDGSAYSWVGPLGTTEISLANYATKAELSQLDQKVDDLGLTPGVLSKNIHNSANAVESETRPEGPDWAKHSMTLPAVTIQENHLYNLSYFIPVTAGTSYKSNVDLRNIAFYDADKVYVPNSFINSTTSAGTAITAPTGAAFIVFQYLLTYSPANVKFGLYADTITDDFETGLSEANGGNVLTDKSLKFVDVVNRVGALETDTASIKGNVKTLLTNATKTKIVSKNLHNSIPAVSSTTQPEGPDWLAHSIATTGAFNTNTNLYNLSYFIPVTAGSAYKSNVDLRHVAFYDTDKVFISGSYAYNTVTAGTSIMAPAGAAFIIIQYTYGQEPSAVKFGLYADTVTDDFETETVNPYLQKFQLEKSLKVLLIGSSFGVNTIVQFPALAIAGGVDVVVGNLFTGGVTLAGIVAILNGDGNFNAGRIYTKQSNAWINATKNIDTMLATYEWDIIILQRAAPNKAGGSDTWTSDMADDLETIIQYIQARTRNKTKFMFNSCFGRSVGAFNGSRANQLASAELIMSTAKDMQEQFGIEVIPAAIAVQNARTTSLSYVETANSEQYEIPDLTGDGNHLDTGVGSYILGCLLFEQILGKRYDLSILDVTTLPTLANVTNNGCFADEDFTQITDAQARIARYAAMCAVREPWTVNEALAERFPYPSS